MVNCLNANHPTNQNDQTDHGIHYYTCLVLLYMLVYYVIIQYVHYVQ